MKNFIISDAIVDGVTFGRKRKLAPQDNNGDAAVSNMMAEAQAMPKAIDLDQYRLDMTKDIVRPDFRIRVDGVDMIPAGSITAVTGKAKQGKSQWLTILASVLISGRPFGSVQRVTTPSSILWIDTEQSAYDMATNVNRLYYAANIPPKADATKYGLHLFMLRPCSPEERVEIINKAIESTNPDIIVLDGIRDLLNDFNDVNQSNAVMTWLMKITATRPGTNIFAVLHTNDGSDKMRGHLGTELMNKCADRFTIDKMEGYFSVTHISRHLELASKFHFKIDEGGHLAPATPTPNMVEDPKDVIQRIFEDAQEDTMAFKDIVKAFAKETALSQRKAHEAVVALNGHAIVKVAPGKFKRIK